MLIQASTIHVPL